MKNLFKYASLLLAAAMLFSCRGNIEPDGGDEVEPGVEGELKISADKNLIQTFDDFATITVTLGDKKLTEGVVFYDGKDNIIEIPDFKFTAASAGVYEIWASYETYITEKISITAIAMEIPQTPNDPQKESTDFKERVLLTQFTGIKCQFCPFMKNLIHSAMENKEVADRLVTTYCHTFSSNNDPAYISTTYDDFAGIDGWPYVFIDMCYATDNYNMSIDNFTGVINSLYNFKKGAAAGIAVNSSVAENQLVAKVTVKAAKDGNYKVGAFLLEDGIKAAQTGATQDWMNTHNNVIRYIDAKTGRNYYGHSIGKIEAGKTTDRIFVWDLEEIWNKGNIAASSLWTPFNMDNLHLVVFVTTVGKDTDGKEVEYISNVIDCPIEGQTQFEYNK